MKRLALIIVLALSFGIILTSCEKENPGNFNEIDGTYTGTYTTTSKTRDFSMSTTPTIELKNGKYSYKKLTQDSYYADGSGDYTIQGNKIIFELKEYITPLEDIGIVDGYLLDGEYNYTYNEGKLTLTKTYPAAADTYHSLFEMEKNTCK